MVFHGVRSNLEICDVTGCMTVLQVLLLGNLLEIDVKRRVGRISGKSVPSKSVTPVRISVTQDPLNPD